MKSVIYGSGANSIVTLYRIHQGGCYFKKDTSTSHSQIKKLQSQLNTMGFDCGTADGKYGDKTVAGVKAFQKAHNLTRDGLFGKASLEALEAELNQSGAVHFDSNCENSSDIGAYGCYDKADDSLEARKYKVSTAMRITNTLMQRSIFTLISAKVRRCVWKNLCKNWKKSLQVKMTMTKRTAQDISMQPETTKELQVQPVNLPVR